MNLWLGLLAVCVAGAIGGAVNAYLTDNGFAWPRQEKVDGVNLTRPGFLGAMFVGAVAAGISWGLYGPFAAHAILGATPEAIEEVAAATPVTLTLSALVGAVLVGIGGSRWLTDQVDKNLLKAAAVQAAGKQGSAATSAKLASARPAQALEIARSM
jgi:hypothetical protein